MADDHGKETLAETWLRSLKNRPASAACVLVIAFITGIASFTESIDKLFAPEKPRIIKENDQDMHLEQAIIGTWRSSIKLPASTGVVVNEIRTTFLPDGIANQRGSYIYQDQWFPIMISGTGE